LLVAVLVDTEGIRLPHLFIDYKYSGAQLVY
jgi:hypothetical protein